MNDRYTITEAANILGVHAHTLRYWEDELQLEIPRNELGHRVYYQEQITMFQNIKNLKEEGYQLNAIRMQVANDIVACDRNPLDFKDNSASKDDKMKKFQEIINEAVRIALVQNQECLGKEVVDRMVKEMNYLAREVDAHQEERYKKLDLAIREKIHKKRKTPWNVNRNQMVEKLKEELKNDKKQAVTQCGKITT